MIYFDTTFSKTTILLCVISVFFIILAFILPIDYSYENHCLENLEVLILFIGCVISMYRIKFTWGIIQAKLYMISAIIFILAIGRELNWGRVFYPIGINHSGEVIFINFYDLWYASIIYPIIMILICMVIGMVCYVFYQNYDEKIQWKIPAVECIYFIFMALASQIIFERELIVFLAEYNQLLEEVTEIIAYISLVLLTCKIDCACRY